jgi:P4 family phage/plasmid primase-like protien
VNASAQYAVGDFLTKLPAPVVVVRAANPYIIDGIPTQRRSPQEVAGLPGTKMSVILPASEFLIRVFDMELRGNSLTFPRSDGSISPSDKHVQIFHGDDDVERVTAFGERAALALHVPANSGSFSTFDLIARTFCDGNFKLAGKLCRHFLADPEALMGALAAKPTIDELTNLVRPALSVVPEDRYANFEIPLGKDDDRTIDDLDERVSGVRPARSNAAFAATTLPVPDPTIGRRLIHMPMTEMGFAERWAAHYTPRWRLHPLKGLMVYTGKVWEVATPAQVLQSVMSTIRFAHDVESSFIENATRESATGKQVEVDSSGKYKGDCRSMESSHHASAISNLISSLPALTTLESDWDKDDHLLNCRLGVVDLRTGVLSPHDPKLMMTMLTSGSGDINVTSTLLQRVLDGLGAADMTLPDFLQRIAGGSVSGATYDVFVQLWGAAQTGKSTLMAGLLEALGGESSSSYAATLKIAHIKKNANDAGDKPEPAITRCRGRRFVYIDEAKDAVLDAEVLKAWTGGTKVVSRGMNVGGGAWLPHFMLVMTGNDRIKLPSDDDGILRRFIPVRIKKPIGKADGSLRDRLIQTQEGQDAILAWAIRGAMAVNANGSGRAALAVPASVEEGLKEYMAKLDVLLDWWDDCVEEVPVSQDPGVMAWSPTTTEIMASYTAWASIHNPTTLVTARTLPDKLEARGFPATGKTTRTRPGHASRQGRFIDGIKLRPVEARTYRDVEPNPYGLDNAF